MNLVHMMMQMIKMQMVMKGNFWNESFAKMLQICKLTVVMGFKPKYGDFVKEPRDGDDVFTIFADRLLKLREFC